MYDAVTGLYNRQFEKYDEYERLPDTKKVDSITNTSLQT